MCCTKPLHNYAISKIFPKHFRNIESDSEYHWLYRMEEKNMLLLVNIKKKIVYENHILLGEFNYF